MPTTNPLRVLGDRDPNNILETLPELAGLGAPVHNEVVLVRGAGYYRFDEKVFPPDPCEEGVRVVPTAPLAAPIPVLTRPSLASGYISRTRASSTPHGSEW
jgi:hypothetical protein